MTHAYDVNDILVRPLKTRKGKELVDKLSEIHECLEEIDHKPNHQLLDDESSQEIKSYLKWKDFTFQFVPPQCYQSIQEPLHRNALHVPSKFPNVSLVPSIKASWNEIKHGQTM